LPKVKDEIYIHSLETGAMLKQIAKEYVGSLEISGRRDQAWFFARFTGFTNPGIVARYKFTNNSDGELNVWREPAVQGLAGTKGFLVEQVRGFGG
jgi:prolyl oligopeptidase